jgi:hypothetical protein
MSYLLVRNASLRVLHGNILVHFKWIHTLDSPCLLDIIVTHWAILALVKVGDELVCDTNVVEQFEGSIGNQQLNDAAEAAGDYLVITLLFGNRIAPMS